MNKREMKEEKEEKRGKEKKRRERRTRGMEEECAFVFFPNSKIRQAAHPHSQTFELIEFSNINKLTHMTL
jgi:hypothetical protein